MNVDIVFLSVYLCGIVFIDEIFVVKLCDMSAMGIYPINREYLVQYWDITKCNSAKRFPML